MQAKLAILAEALFPNLSARIAALVNSILPEKGSRGTALPGWQVRGSFPPKFLSALSDQASQANNEL